MRCATALAASLLAVAGGACTRVVDAVTVAACLPGSTDSECGSTAWPIAGHSSNSDPWLVQHNLVITSMSPTVLVLNFDNGVNMADTETYVGQVIAALAAGSIYHGYSNSSAKPFLNYTPKFVDLRDNSQPPAINQNIPQTPSGAFDPTALFSAQFAPKYGFTDSSSPSGYLTLCQLFEKGIINEVWIQDGGDMQTTPRAPLYAERKQVYDGDGHAVPNEFEPCISGGSDMTCLNVECGVTVRMAHLDPSPNGGPGCDLYVRGWGIDGMWGALPALATDANAFLNQNFDTRFGVSFDGWSEVCDYSGTQCVSYPNQTEAVSTAGATASFDIQPFLQGCGNSQFPPNGTFRFDVDNSTAVQSRCEHFGLHDGDAGMDQYLPYPPSEIATLDATYTGNSRCNAGWEVYWRQSMPGYQNLATSADGTGTPMPNWWPVLFY